MAPVIITKPFKILGYPEEVLKDSPYLYWRLGESSGTTAFDISGNARHGTLGGSTLPSQGEGGAIVGDPDTSYGFDPAATPDDPDIDSGNIGFGQPVDFSFECWVYFDTLPTTSNWISFVGTANSTLTSQGVHLGTDGSNPPELQGGFWNNIAWQFAGPTSGIGLSTSTWYYLAVTKSTNNGLILYLDGSPIATCTAPLCKSDPVNHSNIFVGYHVFFGETLDGRIDEVAVYQTALSAGRISAHYNAGI